MSNYFTLGREIKMEKIFYATVDTGDNSSPYTTFTATPTGALVMNTNDDHYNGYTLKFTSGALDGTEVSVVDYTASTSEFVVENTGAEIATGVTFDLYHTIIVEDKKHSQPFTNLSILIHPTSIATYDYQVLYDSESQQSGEIVSLIDMITYSDSSHVFPANETNANWARQAAGYPVIGYPISIKLTHKFNSATLFKISIISETASSVI